MELASSARIPDGFMAAMRLGGEKPHQGLPSSNPALYQGPNVCNSTTALGMRGQAELNRAGSRCTGKERDSESGNDYFEARYYSSAMGRFMSPDWSAKEEPIPYAKLDDPQTLNLYGYLSNNPLGGVDADGHEPDCVCQALIPRLPTKAEMRIAVALTVSVLDLATHGAIHKLLSSSAPGEQGRDAQGKFLPTTPGQTAPGADAEKGALDAEGATKTGTTLPGTNRKVDGTVTDTGQKIEVKSGEAVNNTGQLVAAGQATKATTGQPLLVVTTNPNVKVSAPAQANKNLVIRPVKQPQQ